MSPWTKDDVGEHKKGLDDSQKEKWISTANDIYQDCMKSRGNDKFCSGKAIRIANAQVGQKRKI